MLQQQNIIKKYSKALAAAVATVVAVALTVGAYAGTTQAYLMSKTDTYLNAFVSGLPEVGHLTISGTKVLEGRSLAYGEFGFELYETNSDFVVSDNAEPLQVKKNALDGAFSFDEIEYTDAGDYYYVVSEQVPAGDSARPFVTYDETEYRVTVTVTEENNVLVAEKSVVAYEPKSIAVDSVNSSDVELNSDAEVDSDAEIEADLEDEQVQEFEEISDRMEDVDPEGIVFTNQFESPNAIVVVNGLKLLDGRELKPGEFVFDLYEVDSTYQLIEGSDPIQHAINLTGGWFGFIPLSYADEGTFHYVISERVPSAGEDLRGVSYDASTYRLQVDVKRSAETGVLFADVVLYILDENGCWIEAEEPSSVQSASELNHYVVIDPQNATGALAFVTFENSYSAKSVSMSLTGSVDLLGRDMADEEFSFVIEPVNDAPTFDYCNDGNDSDGSFQFGSAEFVEPGVYEYVVKQDTSAQLEGVVYDESVHRVIVKVVDDGAGNLVIQSVIVLRNDEEVADGSGIKYVNEYKESGDGEQPESGDPVDPDNSGDSGDSGGSDNSGDSDEPSNGELKDPNVGDLGEDDAEEPNKSGALGQTGDDAIVLLGIWSVVALCAAGAAVLALRKLRKA